MQLWRFPFHISELDRSLQQYLMRERRICCFVVWELSSYLFTVATTYGHFYLPQNPCGAASRAPLAQDASLGHMRKVSDMSI